MVYFLSIVSGLIVGLVFSAIKLPLPAPPALPGVLGIFGIYLGHIAWPYITKLFS